MGVVVAAEDLELGRPVAIKLMACGQHSPAMVSRFLREAQMLAKMEHPGVVRIYDVGQEGEEVYLVSELLEGRSLDRLPETTDPLPLMLEVAEAIEAVHDRGLVHRDIKPGNLFLTMQGRVVLLDFGLALDPGQTRLTATGTVVGTPGFMAPELLRGERAGPPVDWYAWGASLYWLRERRSFRSFDEVALLAAGDELDPPPLVQTPEDSPTGRLIRACTGTDPETRPANLAELRALADVAEPTAAESEVLPAVAPVRKSRGAGQVALVVACFIALVAAFELRPQRRVEAPTPSPSPSTEGTDDRDGVVDAVMRELDLHGPPELPYDPTRLLVLEEERPALARWLAEVGSTPPPQLPELVSRSSLALEDRLRRVGLPAPLTPYTEVVRAQERDLWKDVRGLEGGPDLEAVVGDLVLLRNDVHARKEALVVSSADLPVAEWRRFAARMSGVESLVEDAFLTPSSRAAVAAWLRPGGPALLRVCRRIQRALDGPMPDGISRLDVMERLSRALAEVELFFWSEVAFLPVELVLGPPGERAESWALRARVLARLVKVRQSAGAPIGELAEAVVFTVERAIQMAAPKARPRVALRAVQALGSCGDGVLDAGVHRHLETLLTGSGAARSIWVLESSALRWVRGEFEEPARSDAARLVAWFRAHPRALQKLEGDLQGRLRRLEERLASAEASP
jgi:hypothetical protein